jgi:hypothetical protein
VLRAVAYKLKHNLTTEAFRDIPHAFPRTGVPSWTSAQTKLLHTSGLKPILYDCCYNSCCCFTSPHEKENECPYCRTSRFDVHRRPRKQFLYIPLIPRLQAFLRDQAKALQMLYRSQEFQHNPNRMKDIFDGSHYQSLLDQLVSINGKEQQHRFFQDLRDIALGLSTDGYAPFRKRKKTAWPLFIYNYNLPPEVRFLAENVLHLGVIPGPKKPADFDSFIWPLVEELLMLELGVESWDSVRQECFLLHAYLLVVFGDIPAMSMVMRMKGHNGIHPCRHCEIEGVQDPDNPRSPYYVPLDRSRHPHMREPRTIKKYNPLSLPLRTHERFMEQGRSVQMALTTRESEDLAKETGVKGVPLLSCLSSLSFPKSFPYDFMHLIWENVMKLLFQLWTGDFKKMDMGSGNYELSAENLKEIGRLSEEAGSTIPHTFGPRPPNISSDGIQWTADLRSFWCMHLAPRLLKGRLPAVYFKHFIELVKLLSMCLEFDMETSKIETMRLGFAKWVKDYERYVYIRYCLLAAPHVAELGCTTNLPLLDFPPAPSPYTPCSTSPTRLRRWVRSGQIGRTLLSVSVVGFSVPSRADAWSTPALTSMCCTSRNLRW